jgi:hypothetical protein
MAQRSCKAMQNNSAGRGFRKALRVENSAIALINKKNKKT